MKRLLNFLFLISFCVCAFAQQEATYWYFGNKAGLQFKTGGSLPFALSNSAMNADEGCATMSDYSGNLLFYTNGETVWNWKHAVMDNGSSLNGSAAVTQCAVIVPYPSKPFCYILFTLHEADTSQKGLQYSVIDMSQNGGEGKVISKNVKLKDKVGEKMAVTRHANGTDFWVVVTEYDPPFNGNEFYAFRVDASGVSINPVSSTVADESISGTWLRGQMKISPDGSKIAVTRMQSDRKLAIYDFSPKTGLVTGGQLIESNYIYYGIEFSPNSKMLYATTGNKLHQFVVGANMLSTMVEVTGNASSVLWGMQLGLDGKIYISRQSSTMSYISDPDQTACGFRDGYVGLALGKNALQGLPSYPAYLFHPQPLQYDRTCKDSAISFSLLLNAYDSVRWNFDDPGSANNTSVSRTPSHVFNQSKSYIITAKIWLNGKSQVITRVIDIQKGPVFSLGADRVLCKNQIANISIGLNGLNYLWNTGATAQTISIKDPGTYIATAIRNGCAYSDTMEITIDPIAAKMDIKPILPNLCEKQNRVMLDAEYTYAKSADWLVDGSKTYSGTKDVEHVFATSGMHDVEIALTSFNGCVVTATKQIFIHPLPQSSIVVTPISPCGKDNKFEFKNTTPVIPGYTFNSSYEAEGNKFNQLDLVYNFTGTGQQKVLMLTTTNVGCVDTLTYLVEVDEQPLADFTVTVSDSCLSTQDYTLTDNTKYNGTSGYTYSFVLPQDVSLSGDKLITSKAGILAIKFVAVAGNGCRDSIIKNIEVLAMPKVAFSTQQPGDEKCLGTGIIIFTDKSTGQGAAKEILWNIDGSAYNGKEVTHLIAGEKLFDVDLRVTAENGCKATVSKRLGSFKKPEAAYSISNIAPCEKDIVKLDFSPTLSKGRADDIYWQMPDLAISRQTPLYMNCENAGPVILWLYAVNTNGCKDSLRVAYMVNAIPNAGIVTDRPTQCVGENKFRAEILSSSPLSDIRWYIGDEFMANTPVFIHSFNGAGDYNIKAIVKANGCSATLNRPVKVLAEPVLNFRFADFCENEDITVQNKTYQNGAQITEWIWTIEKLSSSRDFNPVFTNAKPGLYDVTLTTTTLEGCRTNITKTAALLVKPAPTADYTYSKADWQDEKTMMQFKPVSNMSAYSYTWIFGNGVISHDSTPRHTFNLPGEYTVTLKVESANGCSNEVSKSFYVSPPLDVYFANAFTPNGNWKNETFGPDGNGRCRSFNMQIFNRWGSMVFSSDNWYKRWNGYMGDTEMEQGAYNYRATIVDEDGRSYNFYGSVLLIR